METVTRSNEVRFTILPGSTLTYGQYTSVAKAMALVYGLWLVGGLFVC